MLSLVLAALLPAGFHLFAQPREAAACRTRPLVAITPAEEAARAAWLAKVADTHPDWAVASASAPYAASASAAPYDAAATPAPLVPGAPILTLEAADEMTNVALREAAARGFNPVSVIVVNAAGQMLVHKTMLGTPSIFPEFAREKANLCLSLIHI